MPTRRFAQVNVFSTQPLLGNPVAVVVDGEGISEADMQAFARWTNLSETTFLLPPTTDDADYRVRILTPDGELPFAGHPTLGSAHAWREAGGVGRTEGRIVQECAAGLVILRRDGERWAFAGPPLTRYEPLDAATLAQVCAALRIDRDDVLDASWLVNGPQWIGVRLASAAQVLAIRPDGSAFAGLDIGVVGPHPEDDAGPHDGGVDDVPRPDVEIRAFVGEGGGYEDPVTGSFNAGVGRWLVDTGLVPASYVAAQGTVLHRAGRVHVRAVDGEIWVGGDATTVVAGTVTL
ncbi:PhzF family phenazine biosynthesis protein [Cellulomonas fimi]|uniref:PhzF family phenazine biosynthesis protein n=1 Tax=Cellulomonas fimi TaxID=1708 RepID=A0A7Y0LZS4_CELFI|nr:PhzF family phenazine biosynthesis protein [Cellulomonas fimi]NMR21237.1 PhzF family phenazine biosynthesis protein [Cellulomonas fimi]